MDKRVFGGELLLLTIRPKRAQSLTGCIFLTPAWLLMRCHCFLWLDGEHSLARTRELPSCLTQQFSLFFFFFSAVSLCVPALDLGTQPSISL